MDYYESYKHVWAEGIDYGIAYYSDGIVHTEVVGYNKNEISSDVVIPEKVPGTDYKVNYIADYAFACNKSMKTLTIEGSQDIQNSAFMACSNLEKVTFNQVRYRAMKVDNGAFAGCSSLKEFVVNEPVDGFDYYSGQLLVLNGGLYCDTSNSAEDYRYMLICYPGARTGNKFVLEPKSKYFSTLDGNSLNGNRNITSIISNDTEHYQVKDGVLFSQDMKVLYCYPAGKKDATYVIPDGVTEIAEGAFYNASNLQKLYIPDSVIEISDIRSRTPWLYSIGVLETSSESIINAPNGVVGPSGTRIDGDVCWKMCQPNYNLMVYCGNKSVVYDVAKVMSSWAGTKDYGLNINDIYYLKGKDKTSLINIKNTRKTNLKNQKITTAKIKKYKVKRLKKRKLSLS